MGTILTLASISICIYLLWVLIKSLQRTWFTPLHIQQLLNSQGIKGPPYRFIHGNNKQVLNMRIQSKRKPLELSHDVLPRIHPHTHFWLRKYGKNFVTWHGTKAEVVITEPELVKEILVHNREKAYTKIDRDYFFKKLLGDGLLSAVGEKWAKLRRLANHAFRAEFVKSVVPIMIESSEMMLERWKDYEGKEIEVWEEFRLLTSEVISKTAFGSSYLEGIDIFDKLRRLAIIISRNSYRTRLPIISTIWKTNDEKEAEKLEQGIGECIIEIVKKKEKVLTGLDNSGEDLLSLLVKAHHDEDANNRLTIENIIDECKTFYLAGQETTNSLLSWTVLLLATHSEWQEKARQEVLQLFGQQNPNVEGLAKMKTMSMIINESLRLYPSLPAMSRKVQHSVKLGSTVMPANINLVISILAIHHDPETWGEDVHEFKPERFSEGIVKATNNNLAVYLPFGLGQRSCVGMNLAINEAKIALTMILQRYAITLSPSYRHSPVQVLTIYAQHGIQIILHAFE